MARISPLFILPPAIFAGLAGLFFAGMMRDNPDELPSTLIGQPAPGLPESGLPGTVALTTADLTAGEVTLVNFWASWCPPCRAEHPTLHALTEEGIRVAGINFRDDLDNAQTYLADEGDPFFATGLDPRGRTSIDWGVTAPPETFIVGGDGTVLFRFTGPLIGSDYEQRFRPALEAALAAAAD
jgi:cytochrome c biogenesis protein CcmG, thiol:disulfide interchange protein DsbE